MKKLYTILTLFITLFTISACGSNDEKTIKVIATQIPHAEILNYAKELLELKGYKLEVITTSDYYFPNPAVAAGDADANYFQHIPFLDAYNLANPNKQLVIAARVHIEPIGLYSNSFETLSDITDGATVLLSNSISDHGRALKLFKSAGLITLKDDIDITSPTFDINQAILTNPKNLKFRTDVSPDFMLSAYKSKEADLYVINSNYALEGGLNPLTDSIFYEQTDDNPYVNVLAVKESLLIDPKIKAFIEVLQSAEIKTFITNKYMGSVIPA